MGYHFGPLNDTYCLKSGKCILHPVVECAIVNKNLFTTGRRSQHENRKAPQENDSGPGPKEVATDKSRKTLAFRKNQDRGRFRDSA